MKKKNFLLVWLTARVVHMWKHVLKWIVVPPRDADALRQAEREEYARQRALLMEERKVKADEEEIHNLNKTWRNMLKNDPWMIKLMTHVTLLTSAMGLFFLTFWMGGLFLPARHPMFNYICAGIFATIPYWLWVGSWHCKIEQKVFAEFKMRFGKNFHLH